MAINKLKPVTPGTRFRSNSSFDEITKTIPEKSLTVYLTKSGGRNNHGRVTARHRGGGHKRQYRIIDFNRDIYGQKIHIELIEKIREIKKFPNLIELSKGIAEDVKLAVKKLHSYK